MIEFDPTKSVLERCLPVGSRTFYFDVKQTKANDYFLIITERKKDADGKLLKSQKLFLYKEYFTAFTEILDEMTGYIISEKGKDVLR